MKPKTENVKRQLSGALKPSARILGKRHLSGGETREGNCGVSPRAIWLVTKPLMRHTDAGHRTVPHKLSVRAPSGSQREN